MQDKLLTLKEIEAINDILEEHNLKPIPLDMIINNTSLFVVPRGSQKKNCDLLIEIYYYLNKKYQDKYLNCKNIRIQKTLKNKGF